MVCGRAAMIIMTDMIGTAITPLMTADQKSARTGSIDVKHKTTPPAVAAVCPELAYAVVGARAAVVTYVVAGVCTRIGAERRVRLPPSETREHRRDGELSRGRR